MSDHMFLLGGADHLPLTIREILYRLVGAHGYEKTEQAYDWRVTGGCAQSVQQALSARSG